MEKRLTRAKGGRQSGREMGSWSIARLYSISVYKYDIISEQDLLIKNKIKCHSKIYKAFRLFCN